MCHCSAQAQRPADEDDEDEGYTDSPFAFFGRPSKRKIQYDGQPLRILAVSYPFLCVTTGQQKFSLDLRRWDVMKVTRQYAQAMASQSATDRAMSLFKRPAPKPDPQDCPKCGYADDPDARGSQCRYQRLSNLEAGLQELRPGRRDYAGEAMNRRQFFAALLALPFAALAEPKKTVWQIVEEVQALMGNPQGLTDLHYCWRRAAKPLLLSRR